MKIMKTVTSLLMALFIAVTAVAQQPANKEGLQKGDQVPNFKHKDISGNEVSLSDFAGKYIYLDVWATWCGPCKAEIPHLKELEKKMHGKNVVFMSISVDKDVEAWKTMVVEDQLVGVQLHNGGDRIVSNAFGIKGIPRFIIIGPDGKVVEAKALRPSTGDEILNYLNTLPGIDTPAPKAKSKNKKSK